jgi:hypothetical protein
MVSKTKYPINNSQIQSIFSKAGFGDADDITPLGKGEFNAVFSVSAYNKESSERREYVIKIAPPDDFTVMHYEKDMMATEEFWYKTVQESTPVKTPQIYFSDYSRDLINAPYIIMEKIHGPTLDRLPKELKPEAFKQIAFISGHLHNVKNNRYGYIQNELYDNWYDAIRSMTEAVIKDCITKNKSTKHGKRLLGYIDSFKDVLIKAECCMVSFDLWEPNVILMNDGADNVWIDPERGFWGDPVMDLVCLEMMSPLEDKAVSINAHNEVSEIKIELTPETSIRYGIALAYLGLIMDTERYYRYSPLYTGWWRNIMASRFMFSQAFRRLSQH